MNSPNNIPQEEFERIESFLLNSMPTSERTRFEKELLENKEFSIKVNEVAFLVKGIEEIGLRSTLEGFHQDLKVTSEKQSKSSSLFSWPTISIAASLLLLMSLFTWLVWLRPSAEEQLFLAHFQPDPGLVTAMGGSMEYEFDRGMVDYKLGDYNAAIHRWERLQLEKPENDTLNYFLGAAYLSLKNTDSAEFYFQKVVNGGANKFTDDAYWYMALTHVLKKDFAKAIENLHKSNHPEKETLIQLLQQK